MRHAVARSCVRRSASASGAFRRAHLRPPHWSVFPRAANRHIMESAGSGTRQHERKQTFLARGLESQRRPLRDHPHACLQRAARIGRAERSRGSSTTSRRTRITSSALDALWPSQRRRRRMRIGSCSSPKPRRAPLSSSARCTARFSSNTASRRSCSRKLRSRRRVTTMFVIFSPRPMPNLMKCLLAALLPCFWIYAEVGRDIHARAAAANPYRAWIDTYAGEEFHAAVRAMIAATDDAAKEVNSPLARAHACGFHPRRAARVGVLGLRLPVGDLARLGECRSSGVAGHALPQTCRATSTTHPSLV